MVAKNQITIRRVAREAGVSTQTVSRVINDRPDVAPETRRRVQEAIARLGYLPNALARGLSQQRSHTIGVVAVAWEYYAPMRFLVGIEQQIRAMGYNMLLDLLHHPDTENVDRILYRLLSNQVDGIIWAVPEIGNNRVWLSQNSLSLPVPAIYLTMQSQPSIIDISIDNREGGRIATQHLLSQGYKKVGIITGPIDWWEARQRKEGWQEALQTAGLAAETNQVVEGNWSANSGQGCLLRLLEQFPEMDAVFAGNDQMALGVLQTAHQLGLRVPEDLGVVGFDNIPESAYYWPALTTVYQPLLELGWTAVKELAKLVEAYYKDEAAQESRPILLQPELVIRSSSKGRSINESSMVQAMDINL
jgi:LacI family transcriptional regulator